VRFQSRLTNYIKIEEKDVFLDEEVNDYLQKLREEGSGNGEFHYYDYEGTLKAKMTGQCLEPVIVTV
jgi:hypothetical protein